MIEVNIKRERIVKQLVTKLDCAKIDIAGDTAMKSAAPSSEPQETFYIQIFSIIIDHNVNRNCLKTNKKHKEAIVTSKITLCQFFEYILEQNNLKNTNHPNGTLKS